MWWNLQFLFHILLSFFSLRVSTPEGSTKLLQEDLHLLRVSCIKASIENTWGWTQCLLQPPGYENLFSFHIQTKSKKNNVAVQKGLPFVFLLLWNLPGLSIRSEQFLWLQCLISDKILENFLLLIALVFLPSLTVATRVTIRFIFTSINIYLYTCVHIRAYIPSFSQLDRYSISHHESML